EDETLHLRVPASCLVAEVNSSLQQLLHGDDCQRDQPLSVWFRLRCSGGPGTEPGSGRGASAPPPGRWSPGSRNVTRAWYRTPPPARLRPGGRSPAFSKAAASRPPALARVLLRDRPEAPTKRRPRRA